MPKKKITFDMLTPVEQTGDTGMPTITSRHRHGEGSSGHHTCTQLPFVGISRCSNSLSAGCTGLQKKNRDAHRLQCCKGLVAQTTVGPVHSWSGRTPEKCAVSVPKRGHKLMH